MNSTTTRTTLWAGAAAMIVGASLVTLPAPAPAGSMVTSASPGQRCYAAKRTKGFDVPAQVALIQDTLQATNSTIGKPFMVCIPALVATFTGGINGTAGYIDPTVCYKVKDAKGTPKFPAQGAPVNINATISVVGDEHLDVKGSKVVCLPFAPI